MSKPNNILTKHLPPLQRPVSVLTGVGTAVASQLHKLGIEVVGDVLFHLPRAYEDRSQIVPILSLSVGQLALLEVSTVSVDHQPFKRTLTVQVTDGVGRITLRFFNVYQGLMDNFKATQRLRIFGEVRYGYNGLEMHHPELRRVTTSTPLPKLALTPVYPLTEGLSQPKMRTLVTQALQVSLTDLTDLLPKLSKASPHGFSLSDALRYIHAPPIEADVAQLLSGTHPAQKRLVFEELIAHQLGILTRHLHKVQQAALAFVPSERLLPSILAALPYTPTQAQLRVLADIQADMQRPYAMNRLVQGDVGSGKTLVAMMAACSVLEANKQVALMAPTELLAEQHVANFSKAFEHLGITIAWLSGSQSVKVRQHNIDAIANGTAQMVIGTHALFQTQIQFAQLGLVIIDEQHRFGVEQRLMLNSKGKNKVPTAVSPHQLVMTATPIPRTLAMSLYSDMDTSIIDELPPNRKPITTVTMPVTRKSSLIERLALNCAQGKQAYWVCTLVDDSEQIDAQAAQLAYQALTEALPHLRIGLVHGKLKSEQKNTIMADFKNHTLDVLVATTVIEVGVDVPNASIMVIENAERLGLSQLHQLRGRVGRGDQASYCVLLYKPPLSVNGTQRLAVMRDSQDGFVIAEKDLQLRGPGELFGTRQTGALSFKVADLARDYQQLAEAHRLATLILASNHMVNDGVHSQPQLLSQALIQRWLPKQNDYTQV